MWAILEPVFFIGVLTGVRIVMHAKDVGGLPNPLFFASGVLIYLLFSHSINVSISAVEANVGVLNYRRVKAIDTVVARVLVEILIFVVSSFLIFIGFRIFGYDYQLHSVGIVIAAMGIVISISIGAACIVSVVGAVWAESKKLIPILIRPLFFISGVFFMVDSFPEKAQKILLYNPILHCIEMFRIGMFEQYEGVSGSIFYASACALFLLALGLGVLRLFREKVISSGTIR
jgi:capsular polysaccharide transport system permease protein